MTFPPSTQARQQDRLLPQPHPFPGKLEQIRFVSFVCPKLLSLLPDGALARSPLYVQLNSSCPRDRFSPSPKVAFDSARVLETEAFARSRADKDASEGVLVGEICAARLRPPDDVEALTNLYRKIFNFLVVRAGIAPGSNRAAEREIAAALESVFPRIGLKAFTGLSGDDKAAQLVELANIVLGIRLFNRHIGKGGVAMSDRPGEAANMAYGLLAQVGKELAAAHTLCEQYSGVIAHKYRGGAARPVRLQEELTNRRQYVALLTQTDEGLKQAAEHIDQLTHMLLQEMEAVQDLVGARTSVPKEQVWLRARTKGVGGGRGAGLRGGRGKIAARLASAERGCWSPRRCAASGGVGAPW